MAIFVFGNRDIPQDALPLRILERLKKLFPNIQFKTLDPNEEWEMPEELTIIDTVIGIDRVKIFSDIDQFFNPPRVSLHDFDVTFHLKYLKKLGKLQKIKIIGIPPTISEQKAIEEISAILNSS
jgi:Ni,Fe-hydrogenase maturation factor